MMGRYAEKLGDLIEKEKAEQHLKAISQTRFLNNKPALIIIDYASLDDR
jgi:hypothetical protein